LPHEFVKFRPQAEAINGIAGSRRLEANQLPMLTSVVHVMEGKEEVGLIPSVVWLETFNRYLVGSGKPLYLFTSAALKLGEAARDRKIHVFFSDVAVALGEFICEQIKTAPQAGDDGSRLGVDELGDGITLANAPSLIASLRVFVSDRGVWATIDPVGDSLFKNVELGYGPIHTAVRV
jgi:hypothetical protein